MNTAIFLDRDGTLIEDVGIIADPSQIQLYPETIPTLIELGRHFLLFVVTNQNGIAKGIITAQQAEAVNAALDNTLRQHGVDIRRWYVCPHHRDDGCECIKPNPAFLRQAAVAFGLDLTHSYVIGDHPHDPATADAVGATGLYVLTGHGQKHLTELPKPYPVFQNLSTAAAWILSQKFSLDNPTLERHPLPLLGMGDSATSSDV